MASMRQCERNKIRTEDVLIASGEGVPLQTLLFRHVITRHVSQLVHVLRRQIVLDMFGDA